MVVCTQWQIEGMSMVFNNMFVQQGGSPVRDPTVLNPLTGKFLERWRYGELLGKLLLGQLNVGLTQDGIWAVPDVDHLIGARGFAGGDGEAGGASFNSM